MGSVEEQFLDLAKAVSIMLSNKGIGRLSRLGFGKDQGVYHVGIPTISGTGAEVSRTTVLNWSGKKIGNESVITRLLIRLYSTRSY